MSTEEDKVLKEGAVGRFLDWLQGGAAAYRRYDYAVELEELGQPGTVGGSKLG